MTDLVASVASNLELLAYNKIFLLAALHGVAELAALMAHGNTAIDDKAGFLKMLQVLLGASRPANATNLVARLGGPIEVEDVGLVNDAGERGNGHVVGDVLLLLLGDEMDVHTALTEAALEVGGVDWRLTLLHDLAVREEVDLEIVHVLVIVGDLHSGPGVFCGDCRSIRRPDVGAGSGTFGSAMTFIVAQATNGRRL